MTEKTTKHKTQLPPKKKNLDKLSKALKENLQRRKSTQKQDLEEIKTPS